MTLPCKQDMIVYAALKFSACVSEVDGHQTTPCAEGWKEQHISLDVALAVWEAAVAAGNPRFMQEEAWPVLRGVAEWIGSRGVHTERGFEIHNIEGPDEGIGNVNNSNYVNIAAMMVLERAIECHESYLEKGLLRDPSAVARWRKMVDTFYLAREGDVILPFVRSPLANYTVHLCVATSRPVSAN